MRVMQELRRQHFDYCRAHPDLPKSLSIRSEDIVVLWAELAPLIHHPVELGDFEDAVFKGNVAILGCRLEVVT